MTSSDPTTPDSPPKELNIGAINPFALVGAMIGRCIDKTCPDTARTISDVLQTEYAELFDMRYHSVLHAGLKLNSRDNRAERMDSKDIHILTEGDMATPDMSRIKKLGDLEHVGLKDVLEVQVQDAHIRSGKVRLVLHPHALGRTLSNSAVTESLCETSTPFRQNKRKEEWVPPNCEWQDMSELSQQIQRMRLVSGGLGMGMGMGMGMSMEAGMPGARTIPMHMSPQAAEQMNIQRPMFNDPVQGAVGNSWLVAALFAVAWADPYKISRDNSFMFDKPETKSKKQTFNIKLYSKGGENDAPTSTVEVNFDITTNNSFGLPIYCQPNNRIGVLWPSLYEKAFAKWLTKGSEDHPDITQTSASANGGDPVKAMAQINDGKPHYFFTSSRSGAELVGLVRANSVNFRTIQPMVAFTHASGNVYKGCNIVGNHAYTVLGWALAKGGKSYMVLRNPWGVTEPAGMTTYPGLLDMVDADFWSPADMLDPQGVLALEADAFKEYFACLGMAKQTHHNHHNH